MILKSQRFPSLQEHKEEGANPKEDDSPRAQEGLSEKPIENAHVELPTSRFHHLTNGILEDRCGVEVEIGN
jgi:hypothetical protein